VPTIRGIYAPLATPFDHLGRLYGAKVRSSVERLNRTRLAGYVVAGSAGEGPLLSSAEKVQLWKAVREAAADDKQLFAAISCESVAEALELAAAAADAGFHYLALTAPAAYRGSFAEPRRQKLFFESVADRAQLPIVMHAIADRLEVSTAVELAAHPQIVGLWCAEGAANLRDEAAERAPAGFAVLSGLPEDLPQASARGCAGAILAAANAIPFHLLSIDEAIRTRETAAADELSKRASPLFEALAELGPAGLKHAMDLRGAFGGAARLPLPPLDSESRRRIEQALADILN